ncbi:MAG: cytidine deaminase [Candidatus Woesearchaeota archaeon]|jgi:cytidine deaminase|nr:cytidine deaminase [Candidatus Woesearchaeota archaeon]MDP7505895.1 cytidine deaminase [Candidatus Woesearchaeota archaeon]MDP7610284.1 cytidine deaminase [Candidatus Woesearchaeota archaeon]|tara:strand:- start:202 stop:591 length:390 start_codon:yes stop_codon:yes gene_type:complete
MITNKELIRIAEDAAKKHKCSKDVEVGDVGCALVTDKNNVYVGVSIQACCGIGFCAESGAISSMVTNREYRIKRIVAVNDKGKVLPPCGRCRELMFQIDEKNYDAEIVLGVSKTVKLRRLLPDVWQRKV